MAWDVFFTEVAEAWLDAPGEDDFDRVMAAADLLSEQGPGGDWTGWYERNIPLADGRFDQHLREEGST